jgi:hypothetical protein
MEMGRMGQMSHMGLWVYAKRAAHILIRRIGPIRPIRRIGPIVSRACLPGAICLDFSE